MMREVLMDPIEPPSVRAAAYGVAHLLPARFDVWFARCVVRDVALRHGHARAAVGELAEILGSAVAAAPFESSSGAAPRAAAPLASPSAETLLITPQRAAPTEPIFAPAPFVTQLVAPPAPPAPLVSTTQVASIVESPAPTTHANPWRLVLLALAALGIGGGLLFALGGRAATPSTVAVEGSHSAQVNDPRPVATLSPVADDPPLATTSGAPPLGSAPLAGGCSTYKGDYATAMRGKDYACVRAILLPRLEAGAISTGEARYLKAACAALGDTSCEKRAAEHIAG